VARPLTMICRIISIDKTRKEQGVRSKAF
jgi:hypothetical protein